MRIRSHGILGVKRKEEGMPLTRKCPICGGDAVEQTAEGFFCTACGKTITGLKRMVHHEQFPHTVQEEEDDER